MSIDWPAAGYYIIHQSHIDASAYSAAAVCNILTFSNGSCYIDVVVSKTMTTISPLFQFHSTAVMNFISADSIFCTYPGLTLHRHVLINAYPIYSGSLRSKTMAALQKYNSHGFDFIPCEDIHQLPHICQSMPRSLTDGGLECHTRLLEETCLHCGPFHHSLVPNGQVTLC
ncbi:hypothetical protein M404DRAFT_156900 [Pisolithus tinctorius Marx 270]|uniref:Uncharacterized protein n=1 Tax=Pisolithus tinctorius Marx 270 TaxID=870435 RepID=A0A0C3NTM9_PISTI|nr:hypothetical protein M404DRAFT_156900 [Pisolithus tinctorius Marx 270]